MASYCYATYCTGASRNQNAAIGFGSATHLPWLDLRPARQHLLAPRRASSLVIIHANGIRVIIVKSRIVVVRAAICGCPLAGGCRRSGVGRRPGLADRHLVSEE
jgi:hypothetical protein